MEEWRCPLCGRRFRSYQEYYRHVARAANRLLRLGYLKKTENGYLCNGKLYRMVEAVHHVSSLLDERERQSVCVRAQMDVDGDALCCPLCAQTFTNKRSFRLHVYYAVRKLALSGVLRIVENGIVEMDGKLYTYIDALRVLRNRGVKELCKDREKKYRCPLCGRCFATISGLYNHLHSALRNLSRIGYASFGMVRMLDGQFHVTVVEEQKIYGVIQAVEVLKQLLPPPLLKLACCTRFVKRSDRTKVYVHIDDQFRREILTEAIRRILRKHKGNMAAVWLRDILEEIGLPRYSIAPVWMRLCGLVPGKVDDWVLIAIEARKRRKEGEDEFHYVCYRFIYVREQVLKQLNLQSSQLPFSVREGLSPLLSAPA